MLGGFLVFSLFVGFVSSAKVCTNGGVLSHTSRYELFSRNASWERENLAHLHLIQGDHGIVSNLIPRKMLKENDDFSWNELYIKMKDAGAKRGAELNFLKDVSLHDVRLDSDSVYGIAQQTNLEYLLMLEVDRLVWSFRKTAGLDTPGEPYGGWEAPDVELRGHFVGHYLSASAQMWASTHNRDLREKMSSVVSALSDCQLKMGTGYLSAFPSELFDRVEALQKVWAPYYTIHKILAGLLDQYTFAGNSHALNMAIWMTDYFYTRVQNVITKHTIERHWLSLNEETGGMNDVLYQLYITTGDQKHLLLAHLFDKPCFLGLLALKADDISGFHSNTHIPIVIGAQLRYEITGDPLYKEIGTFFMDVVNASHSYATGGTSVNEFWSDPMRLASTLGTENQESCTTYNMLKVSRYLFRWTKKMPYADYYERAMINGVLGIQRGTDPGVMIYMLPLQPGGSKARSYEGWGTKFNSFWCCYGTGIESFSKLGDSVYFEEDGKELGLYTTQYISSSLDWRSGQVFLKQKVEPVVSWDTRLKVTVTISSMKEERSSTLHLRIPSWTYSSSAKATLNGQDLYVPEPGNFLSVKRSWGSEDKISLDLPMSIRTEAIKDDRPQYASLQAFLYGPYLLASLSCGNWDIKISSNSSLLDCITPIPADYNSQLITLGQESGNSTFVLTNSDQLIKMEMYPETGTDNAVRATFRLIFKNPKLETSLAQNDAIGEKVMLEPFDFPGMLVSHDMDGESLGISYSSSGNGERLFVFRLVRGLDGKNGTVSLESDDREGCFVYSRAVYDSGAGVQLNCSGTSGSPDAGFEQATSFVLKDGISRYHPISFMAKGVTRNFVMAPLYSYRDESYTVYFNVTM